MVSERTRTGLDAPAHATAHGNLGPAIMHVTSGRRLDRRGLLSKLRMMDAKPEHQPWWYQELTYRDADGVRVPGVTLPAFIHNRHFYLTTLKVYQDGVIDCWGLMTFEDFKQKVAEGWVTRSLPEGAIVGVGKFAWFTANEVRIEGEPSDLIKDVANALAELNGRPTAIMRLTVAMRRLKEQDDRDVRLELRRAYDDLPAYDRQFVFGSHMEGRKDVQRIIAETDPSGAA
jgi:hypothetical protein